MTEDDTFLKLKRKVSEIDLIEYVTTATRNISLHGSPNNYYRIIIKILHDIDWDVKSYFIVLGNEYDTINKIMYERCLELERNNDY